MADSASDLAPAIVSPAPSQSRFRHWLPASVALVITALLLAMLGLQDMEQEAFAARDRKAQMRLIAGTLTSAIDQAGKFALALAETTARRADVASALAAGDRPRLQALSQAGYDFLSRQAGVQIYGYHTRDLRYLLRMHRLETANDDISGFRPMVVAANRSRRAQTGVEIGIAGIGIRGIAPVQHDSGLAGTMEIGLDLRPILDMVKASTNADLAVVIAPSMSGVALDPKLPAYGDLTLALSTDDALFGALLGKHGIRVTRDTQIATQTIGTRTVSIISQPLVDFSGRLVGMTVMLKQAHEAEARRMRTELWVLALCGGILAYIAFAVLLRFASGARRTA